MRKEYKLSEKEYEAILKLPAPKRYYHLIKRVADWQVLWSLASEEGGVLLGDNEGHECIPVWPHSRYAQDYAVGEWSDTKPLPIDLDEWMDVWLPGIEEDGRRIAVFPIPNTGCANVTPSQMRDDLEEELAWYQ